MTELFSIVEPLARTDPLSSVELVVVEISPLRFAPRNRAPAVQPAVRVELDPRTDPVARVESIVVVRSPVKTMFDVKLTARPEAESVMFKSYDPS